MSFKELDEFFDSSLRLPIAGREYVISSPDGETGLWAQRLIALSRSAAQGQEISEERAQRLQLDDEEERTMHERLLGEALTEMISDGVAWEVIKLAGTTALLWAGVGTEAAEAFWNAGGSPEAQAPNRETARAAARSTRSRGSARGTTRNPPVLKGEVVPRPGSSS